VGILVDVVSLAMAKRAMMEAVKRPLSFDHTSSPFSLGAGEELTLFSARGLGSSTIIFRGDGDGVFEVRVFVDGALEDSFPTNEARVGSYTWTNSLDVRLRNPTTSVLTQSSSGFNVRGLMR
jgi:hypothetical protein